MTKSILSFNIGEKVQVSIARNLSIYGEISDYVKDKVDELVIKDEEGREHICELNQLEKIED